MEILNTIKDCHKHWHKYDDWDIKNKTRYAKKKYLFDNYKNKNPDEYKKLKEKSDIVIKTVNILDNASENAAQNMQVATTHVTGLALGIPMLFMSGVSFWAMFKGFKHLEKHKNLPLWAFSFLYIAPALNLLDLPLTLWKTKKQIEASRVARAKARDIELKDIKNFVAYTLEQISKAKEIAKTINDKDIKDEDNKNISLSKSFKSTLNLDKEYNKYLKRYKENLGIDKKIQSKLSENYTDKELLEAKKDKELILTGIKEINNNAEKYCENAEAAFATIRLFNFAALFPSMYVINKIAGLVFPKANKLVKTAISVYAPLFILLPINIWFNKKTKEAAKVGRYKMKQEFSKDLSKLAYFDKEELDKVKDVKVNHEKLNIFQRVVKNFKFIPVYLKDREEYLQYKKTTWKEEEKLNKALKQVNVSDEQQKEAKKMQEKIFFVFDELDEMSQKYSEHMEGAVELGKKSLMILKSIVLMTAFVLPAILLFSDKIHLTNLIKRISNIIFDKDSKVKKNIDEIFDILKQDKDLKTRADRFLLVGKKSRKELLTNPKIATQIQNITQILNNMMINPNAKKDFINNELKHTPFAKWIKNMCSEIGMLIVHKLKDTPVEAINKIDKEEVRTALMNLKNTNIPKCKFKSLKLTALFLGIPAFAGIVGISYMLNSFFAHLQKKAGYIGVMKSLKKLDNEKYFAIKEDVKNNDNKQEFKGFNKNYFLAFKN
ncbi:MAG: hypothetical protein MJ180_01165 [Candidatus Gastranaerophilales bacterium]|nr:hypothetical protein [Candidatus Gastranaerophilales bacterium]